MSNARSTVKNYILNSRKITDFLLKENHVDNKGRFKFFSDFGFTNTNPELLAHALLKHHYGATSFAAQSGKVGDQRMTIDGPIETPDGRGANVRSVWSIVDHETARFITVWPLPRLTP